MTEISKGLAAILAACMIWGLSPLFYKELAHIPPLELFAHRIVWSSIFFASLLAGTQQLSALYRALAKRAHLIRMIACAGIICINWFGLIYAVQIEQAIQVSMAYFIYPLFSVLLGYIFLREKLTLPQIIAVLLVAVAVTLLITRLSVPPLLALAMASSFSLYGLIKRNLDVAPMVSVLVEVLLVLPLALIWLWAVHGYGAQALTTRPGAWFGNNPTDTLLLILSGPLTGMPLLLFTYAARRLRMSTIGLVQYINPTLQFLVAVFVFAEPFTAAHKLAFPMIWGALILYTAASLLQERRKTISSSS